MTTRGRKPKPTKLKILEGNPGKRPLNKNEPNPTPVAPNIPSWLHREAKREWRRIAPELERIKILTRIDRAVFTIYCDSWAEFWEMNNFLKKEGSYTYETPAGHVLLLPHVGIRNTAKNMILKTCAEFGMTPSSRSRLELPNIDDSDSEFEKLLD